MSSLSQDVVETKVAEIFADVVRQLGLSDAPLDPDAYVSRDLGIDSLGLVTIAARLGAEFAVAVPEDMFEDASFMTLRQMIDACTQTVLAAPPAN